MSQETYNWMFIAMGFGLLSICKMLHLLYRSLREQINIQQIVLSYYARRAETLAKELEERK